MEQPTSPPSEPPPLVLVVVTLLLAFLRQGVPWESPMSQLSTANPAARAGAPCTPLHAQTPTKGCAAPAVTVTQGEGSARHSRQAQLHGLLLHGVERRLTASHPPVTARTAQLHGHSSAQAAWDCSRPATRPGSISLQNML